jgi:hypothetical protein
MNRAFRHLPLAAVLPVFAAVAQAHPGHDGHEGGGEFTWDFSHLAAHPFATAAAVAVIVALVWFAGSRFAPRLSAQSLRRSSDRR